MSNLLISEKTIECPMAQCINKESLELCKSLIHTDFWSSLMWACIGMVLGALIVKTIDYLFEKYK